MAREGFEASVTSSDNTNSWWQEMQCGSTTIQRPISWTGSTVNRWTESLNPQQLCSEDDVSISHAAKSYASSGLTVDSASHAETLWSQVLISTGCGERNALQDHNRDDGENFLDLLNSKTLAPEMFNLPACDYLKKLDTSSPPWELSSLERHLNNYNPDLNSTGPGLNNLSELVSNWSIAPPNPNLHIVAPPNDYINSNKTSNFREFGSPVNSLLRSFQFGMDDNNLVLGLNNKLCSGLLGVPCSNNNTRNNFSDFISFSGRVKNSGSIENKKRSDSPARTNSRGSGTSGEGKKKRNEEEDSESIQPKKSKQESSTTPSPKVQVPKVKMAEKITALQQIVSPFGKTDTASVLMEAINYINILHEQVQHYNTWGGMDKRENSVTIPDLKSKGLCLVPISVMPQIYGDFNVPDYWTPPYRSCLYR